MDTIQRGLRKHERLRVWLALRKFYATIITYQQTGGDRMPAYYSAGRPCQMRFGNITLPFQIPQDPVLFRVQNVPLGVTHDRSSINHHRIANLAVSFV